MANSRKKNESALELMLRRLERRIIEVGGVEYHPIKETKIRGKWFVEVRKFGEPKFKPEIMDENKIFDLIRIAAEMKKSAGRGTNRRIPPAPRRPAHRPAHLK